MALLETIERDIKQLSHKDLAKLRQWFAEFDFDLWDAQIEADAAAGKLDKLAEDDPLEKFIGRFRSGKTDWADNHDRFIGEILNDRPSF
ncbi:hypothetical protein GMMP15_2010008 [Candidatus Magnetomoraceae bacterium gMMP-15]